MRIVVGTSGYGHAEWRGDFYPDDIPEAHMLGYYALRFPTVEIGRTFYALPEAAAVHHWAAATPSELVLTFKAPRELTRPSHLQEAADGMARLRASLEPLGDKRGPVLFSCPARFRRDLGALERFLEAVTPACRAVLDLGDAAALGDDVRATLERWGAAACATDGEGDGGTPLVPTAPFGYVRLRRASYSDDALEAWADRIAAQPWQEAFVVVAPEDKRAAPKLALRMLEAAEAAAPVVKTLSKVPPPAPLPARPKPLAKTAPRTRGRRRRGWRARGT